VRLADESGLMPLELILTDPPSEDPTDQQPDRSSTQPLAQRVEVNKARAQGTNFERTDRRHPNSAATTRTPCVSSALFL
jgi:hypothetical protein